MALDGEEMSGVYLIQHLNSLAGSHGIGRIDHVENRLVGIKSREVYEAPAAIVLHMAHKALEALTLGREQVRFKSRVAQEYSDVVYNGLWYTRHRRDLEAYIASTQTYVTGTVKLKLYKGNSVVVGRKSPHALYDHELATYGQGDTFDQQSSEGFIDIYGLPVRTQASVQGDAPPPK